MKPTHLLAGLMALATLLLDQVVATQLCLRPDPALMLLLGLAFGQLALLAMWSVLGSTPWLLRLLAVAAVAALLSGPFASATAGRWSEWFLVLGLFSAAVALPTLVYRWAGLCASEIEVESQRSAKHRNLQYYQFTVGGVLSLMTAVGVLLGLARHATFPWQHTAALACYGGCLTLVALTSLWAIVSPQAISWRLGMLTGLCLAAGGAMFQVEHVRDIGFFTMIALIEAVVICLGMTILQSAGLRIEIKRVLEP